VAKRQQIGACSAYCRFLVACGTSRRLAGYLCADGTSGGKCTFCRYISEVVCLLQDHPISMYTILPKGVGIVPRVSRGFPSREVRGFTRQRSVERCSRNLLELGGLAAVASKFRGRLRIVRRSRRPRSGPRPQAMAAASPPPPLACNLFLTPARLAFSIESVPQLGTPQSHAEWLRVSGPLKPRQPDRVHLPGHKVPSPAR
jgi:hypothetical protein